MLNELTLRTVKSHTNFVFFKTGRDVVELNRALLARGIKVGRPFQPYTNWSRVSLQKPEEMKYFVQVYKELFG
jgi:histidinol-phosphate aminotransferase